MSFKRLQRALFRTMAAVVALAILFCIGLYGYRTMFGYTYDSSLSDEDLAASVTADENITNIALFGLDTREGDKQSHSDCMMIVTVDNTRGKIKLISLMRDSLVDIDGYGEDKLNAAYFRGGPSLAIRTINENFGTDIKDYVAVDFEQLVQIVDAIGGVDIDVQNDNELKELNRVIKDYGAERGKEFSGVEKTGLQTLDGVQALVEHTMEREELILALREVTDLERIIGRVVYGSANARDLASLATGLGKIPKLRELCAAVDAPLIAEVRQGLDDLTALREELERAIVDEPPFTVREGGMIREGYDDEVDRLRGILSGGKGFIAQLEAREKEKTGIRTLKVGYNKVFGYYIEVSNSFKDQVPADYIRKQTLVNGERYITQELKDLEHEVLTAHDRDAALEYDLFAALRTEAAGQVTRVQLAASLIAQLDTLCAFAEVAAQNHYCRPEVDESGVIEITAGRHPVVEKVRGDAFFVPNDTHMGAKEDRVAIITGPNMAGKSTYMRQVALIVLMAQVGCFVPAQRAHIGVVDRIFTRIGASDDLSAGQSTFMVEMTEVAALLNHATKKSLLILDEIGRGTSTYDGMAIARAVLEHCAGKLKAKTLFATHYHELTTLEQELPNVRNYNVAVHARGEDIVFLRKIVPGGADRSYGIEVAKLAGLPDTVLKRAREILRELESQPRQPHTPAAREDQVSLEGMAEGAVADIIRRTQVDALSPLEALNLLYELKSKLQ